FLLCLTVYVFIRLTVYLFKCLNSSTIKPPQCLSAYLRICAFADLRICFYGLTVYMFNRLNDSTTKLSQRLNPSTINPLTSSTIKRLKLLNAYLRICGIND